MRIKGKVPARVAATNERKRSNAAGPHKGTNLPRDERERQAIEDQESVMDPNEEWICPPCRKGDHDNCVGGPCSCG